MWCLWQDIETVFALHDKSSENAALAEISGVSGDAARNARRMSQAVLRGVSSGVGRVGKGLKKLGRNMRKSFHLGSPMAAGGGQGGGGGVGAALVRGEASARIQRVWRGYLARVHV